MILIKTLRDIKITVYVFRPDPFDTRCVLEVAEELCSKTTYKQGSFREWAPKTSDCLTAIWYIFAQTKGERLELEFIGNMPRKLMALSSWRFLHVPIENLRVGDVLFVKRRDRTKELTHVGMCVEVDRIFHCSFRIGGAVIIPWRDFMDEYEQTLDLTGMLTHLDDRSPAGSPCRPGDRSPGFRALVKSFSAPTFKTFPGCSPPPSSFYPEDDDSGGLSPGGVVLSAARPDLPQRDTSPAVTVVDATSPRSRALTPDKRSPGEMFCGTPPPIRREASTYGGELLFGPEPATPPALDAALLNNEIVAKPSPTRTPPSYVTPGRPVSPCDLTKFI